MSAGGYKTGLDCKAYTCAAGIGGTPTWVELPITEEPSIDLSADEAEVNNRSSIWSKFVVGKLKAPITLKVSRKVGDTGWKMLRNAFLTRGTVIGVAFASGDITTAGEEVFMADVIVTGLPINEPIGEAGSSEVKLQLAANSDNEPSFADVT
jgi:hypothetical protein